MSSPLPIVHLHPLNRRGDPGRQGSLPEALSAHTRVVVLATPPYSRSFQPIRRPYAEQIGDNLTIIHNAMSLRSNRYWKRCGPLSRLDTVWIHRLLRRQGIHDYILWLCVPEPELPVGMRTDRMIYDCVDPNMIVSMQDSYDVREYKVAAMAKLVFCTAATLLERMQKVHSNAHLLPNAASVELYEAESTATLGLPTLLAGRPGPIIGFMGTIDWRVDCETLTAAAKSLPEYTFCIAGRVNQDQEHRMAEMRKLPNVVMPGAVSTEDGQAYNKAFDVGLIPYLPGYIGDAINPVKMYMYLLTGKPVVSTWTPECYNRRPLVSATRTPEEFAEAIRKAVEPDENARAARIAFGKSNTWQNRAQAAIEMIRRSGLFQVHSVENQANSSRYPATEEPV